MEPRAEPGNLRWISSQRCSIKRCKIIGDLQQTHGWRHTEPITHCVSNQAIFVTTNGQV
jgi:hypothetical protein